MAFGLRQRAAAVGFGEAGDVVHLQADAVADAVREERRTHAGFHRDFRRHRDQAEFAQDARQRQVGVEMQLAVVDPVADLVAHRQLRTVDRVDQRLEFVRGVLRIRARDVARVAVVARTGVDQEAADRLGRQAIAIGVVQHGAMLVERDDVVVGQVVQIGRASCRERVL